MKKPQIVLDTNVLYSALKSSRGASYQLMSMINTDKFDIHLSVPLLIEYEDVTKRLLGEISLNVQDIDDILDYLCSVAEHWFIFYLWRPFLKDPKDDMVLELAVTANCEYIVTFNKKDFKGCELFGITLLTPKEFLQIIGENNE